MRHCILLMALVCAGCYQVQTDNLPSNTVAVQVTLSDIADWVADSRGIESSDDVARLVDSVIEAGRCPESSKQPLAFLWSGACVKFTADSDRKAFSERIRGAK